MDQYDNAESQLAFTFNNQDFMDFLPETVEEQYKSRWSDFNFHDPGVTTYEALQYSFEDFFYRYNFPITDILQGPQSNAFDNWSLRDLHTFYAVTEDDYRRLLATSHFLYNIAVKPTLNANTLPGTVDLICLLDVDVAKHSNTPLNIIEHWEKDLIFNRATGEYFNRQKNCETFIREKRKFVDISASVTYVNDPSRVPFHKNQLVRAALEDYLLPNLDTKDYRYVSKNGTEQREVHNGPLISSDLQRNVVDAKEFYKPSYRRVIVVSELYAVVESLDFVQSVESIKIKLIDGEYQSSILDLGEYTFTQLNTLTINGRMLIPQPRMNFDVFENNPGFDPEKGAKGKFRRLSYSQTLQDSFPANYNMGKNVMSQSAAEVKASASFRAYLYIMDQVRADLAKQMGNLWNVFTIQLEQPYVEHAIINEEPVYEGIDFGQGILSELAPISKLNPVFTEQRLNYLLALNGWGIATDAMIFWDDDKQGKIKNDFLNLVNANAGNLVHVNEDLNQVFRSQSLVLLQEKLRVLFQSRESAVRILEHFMLQPVWEVERGLNFEMTVFLFSNETLTSVAPLADAIVNVIDTPEIDEAIEMLKPPNYTAFVGNVVRMLSPAHVVTRIVWKNADQLDHFDGLLKTAFPPKEVYYLDKPITPQQRYAMTELRDKWLTI